MKTAIRTVDDIKTELGVLVTLRTTTRANTRHNTDEILRTNSSPPGRTDDPSDRDSDVEEGGDGAAARRQARKFVACVTISSQPSTERTSHDFR
jgi:hypothetical protein